MPRPIDSDDGTWKTLPSGTVLAGRYEVQALVGSGGMGSVYAAFDRELGERVALKVLLRARDSEPEVLERFRREVRVARRVTHGNAVRIFDIGEDHGLYFLTMELVEGESLSARLRREGMLAPEVAAEVGRQICEGLGAVHQAGIVHRDLKPANVLLAGSGRVVLTDFGIARSVEGDDQITVDSRMVVGTPVYMAPEQVSGGEVTARTDLYALGLVLYEMTTGHRAFHRDTVMATAAARLQQEPEPPSIHARLPIWLDQAIMACLRREPSRRPPDAAAVRTLLTPTASGDAPTRVEADADETRADSGSTGSTKPPPASVAGLPCTERSLAVLPLRYRGPAADAYLADAMTEELVDLLSMTRGLRVPAVGATQRFVDERDPRKVGAALGVDVVVDGTVQRAGSQLRVAVRLLDAHTGFQTWSDHVDGELRDVFELQDRIAVRVAETLRMRVESLGYQRTVPAEAAELYLRARLAMRAFNLGGLSPDGAAALLERCLELAPEFPPALAAYATVCARLWFLHGSPLEHRDWAARGRDAMTRALAGGPGLPDAHLGAARMHIQSGCYSEAAGALRRALELAPTHAAAHASLGALLCEAGCLAEGYRHLELAVELDPARVVPLTNMARHMALHGERERCDAYLERVVREDPDLRFGTILQRVRMAIWDRDLDALRHWRPKIAALRTERSPVSEAITGHVLGDVPMDQLGVVLERLGPTDKSSPRLRSVLEQCVVEGLLAVGEIDEAFGWLERLADGALVDVDWLEHCPLLVPLVADPRMSSVLDKVRARAQAIRAVR